MIPNAQNTKSVTDLRERAIPLLNQLKKGGPTFIMHRNKPKAVMLSIDEYANLLDMVEDYFDNQTAKELEENREKGGITLEEMAKKYKLKL
ncbi:type II toxin-antitoxin system Phd/YefM family antitoxin [Candidatus Daviesbacteria bacterium]|nr:type II toxin-antitoxin system Phd/YefM family antitoxin [Candidatus Daviesbacteria bacterium]